MKKILVLFIAISFFASFALVACGPSGEQKPRRQKRKLRLLLPLLLRRLRNRVNRRNRVKRLRLHLRPRLHQHQQNSLLLFPGGYVRMDIPLNQGGL